MNRISRLFVLAVIAAVVAALLPGMSPARAAGGGVIDYGETVSGQISDKTYFELWQFTGQKGDRVRITMLGDGGLDPYLGLLDAASEEVLAEDDDSAGKSDAMIEMALPSSGDFIIVATRYDFDTGTSAGSYSLELASSASPQQDTPISNDQPQELEPGIFFMGTVELGAPVAGELADDSYAHLYSVDFQAGDEIVIGMMADGGALDTYVIFATEDGDVLAEDDDSGMDIAGNKTDSLLTLTVPETGSYLVVATRAGLDTGKSSGAYQLVVGIPDAQEPVSNTDTPDGVEYMGDIASGAAASGSISPTSYVHLYTFEGTAGDTVTITMSGSNGLDSYLGLLDPNDEVVAEDDDSAGGTDAQIAIRLPESGSYIIVATRNGLDEGKTTGDYTLELTNGSPAAPSGQTGVGGFGGLPGRSFEIDGGTFYLRGFGATTDPAKSTPLQGLLGGDGLPGRSSGLDLVPAPSYDWSALTDK